jgi:hypothetical protein
MNIIVMLIHSLHENFNYENNIHNIFGNNRFPYFIFK